MAWRWTAYRLGISSFLLFHMGAVLIWNLPACPIKERVMPWARFYMLPLGIWQYWGMFAPDPQRESLLLEAEVVDAQGLRHAYSFPHMGDFSKWRSVTKFRHGKFACNLLADELAIAKKFTARYVVRKLNIPAEAYPLTVQLYYLRNDPPPPGALPDPMIPSKSQLIGNFQFSNPSEVIP